MGEAAEVVALGLSGTPVPLARDPRPAGKLLQRRGFNGVRTYFVPPRSMLDLAERTGSAPCRGGKQLASPAGRPRPHDQRLDQVRLLHERGLVPGTIATWLGLSDARVRRPSPNSGVGRDPLKSTARRLYSSQGFVSEDGP
jgi:hypothetical protein